MYTLFLLDSPRTLHRVENNAGSFGMEYHLNCPLRSNPSPTCSWDVYWCNNTYIDNPFGVDYSGDGGCTLDIKSLTVNYSRICFCCNATNDLGSEVFSFTPIDFNSKSDTSSFTHRYSLNLYIVSLFTKSKSHNHF